MSEFDQFAAAFAAPSLMEWQKDRSARLKVNPANADEFECDAIFGQIRGTDFDTDSGSEVRVLTAIVHVERKHFTASNIAEPPAKATFDAYGLAGWTIDMGQTEWGPVWVKLGLQRETLLSEWQARRNATV